MEQNGTGRPVRADAARNTARILAAAETVLAEDPNAPLERIADAAGLARATVHRRFTSRAALLAELTAQLDQRFLQAHIEARVTTADPWTALNRLAELTFQLKLDHRFAAQVSGGPSEDVLGRLDVLMDRLRAAGVITQPDPLWCRRVCLALLDEVRQLPTDAAVLATSPGAPDDVAARSSLLVTSVVGALGGSASR